MGWKKKGQDAQEKKRFLKYKINQEMRSRLAYGQPKPRKKGDTGNKAPDNRIHSIKTYKSYIDLLMRFADYCIEQEGSREMMIQEARKYITPFMDGLKEQGMSPHTLQNYRSALAKLYQTEGPKLYSDLPRKKRETLVRSRDKKEGDKWENYATRGRYLSEKNELNVTAVNFLLATGMRRKEISKVRKDQAFHLHDNLYIKMEGNQCKGGRPRVIYVLPEYREVVEGIMTGEHEKAFPKVPGSLDVYHCRHKYAQALYDRNARPVDEIPQAERYICRGDKQGTIYDKRAMRIVTESMGHNRLKVIAQNYLK